MLLTYYIRFNISKDESVAIMINDRLMKSWDISEERLNEIAWTNTTRDFPVVFRELNDEIKEIGEREEPEGGNIYIITNEEKNLGAVCIMYPGVLERVAERIGSDFYIIPSSIHECLVLPCSDLEAETIRKMVKNINDTELKKSDVLSYSVYRYDVSDKSLNIDNS